MATVGAKQKLNTRSIKNKYNALKEVENGNPKSKAALKHGYQRAPHLPGWKTRKRYLMLWRKGTIQNASVWGKDSLQT